jgi:hypothetical protein
MSQAPRGADKQSFQLAWGMALAFAGAGMFFRIPQVSPRIAEIAQFRPVMPLVVVSLYIVAVVLLGGGLHKVFLYFRPPGQNGSGTPPEE